MITVLTSKDFNSKINVDELTDVQILNLFTDFNFHKLERQNIIRSDFIVYIGDDRQFKILKNRHPEDSIETITIKDILNLY